MAERKSIPGFSKYEFDEEGKCFNKVHGQEVKTTMTKQGLAANLYNDKGKRSMCFISKALGIAVTETKAEAEKKETAVKEPKVKKEKVVKQKKEKAVIEITDAMKETLSDEKKSKSDKIRELVGLGLPNGEIARQMVIRPQYVHNVLSYDKKPKASE